jgi:MFS family permease
MNLLGVLMLLGVPILVSVIAFFYAKKKEEPFTAFSVGLGVTWLGSVAIATMIGAIVDYLSYRNVASPKVYATPFFLFSSLAAGLILGLIAGAVASLSVRRRQRATTREVLRASELAHEEDASKYSPYYSNSRSKETDA